MSKPTGSRKNRRQSILHRDIKDLEIAESFKRIANIRVTDWELKDIANYRVIQWDLRDILRRRKTKAPPPDSSTTGNFADSAENFVRFVSRNLIDRPQTAVIHTVVTPPDQVAIELEMEKRDAAALIGHGGHTAAAIRRLIVSAGREKNIRVTLRITERPPG